MTSKDLFDLAPHRFDGIEIGRIGRQIEQACAPGLDRFADSPDFVRRQVVQDYQIACSQGGASPCSTQAKNISPFMGPSNSQGAQGPSSRMAEISVLV